MALRVIAGGMAATSCRIASIKARRALATKKLLVRATFFFQYRMYFTKTARVCALLLGIRKG